MRHSTRHSETVTVHLPHWRDDAACRYEDPEMFFPIGTTGVWPETIARAKAVCAGCPVRAECLDYAQATRQPHGIWGGLDEDERAEQRRQRSRARGRRPAASADGEAAGGQP